MSEPGPAFAEQLRNIASDVSEIKSTVTTVATAQQAMAVEAGKAEERAKQFVTKLELQPVEAKANAANRRLDELAGAHGPLAGRVTGLENWRMVVQTEQAATRRLIKLGAGVLAVVIPILTRVTAVAVESIQ